jgi:hypothetical protein
MASPAAAAAALRLRHDWLLRDWLACVGLPPDRLESAVGRDVNEALSMSLQAMYDAIERADADAAPALTFLRAYVRRSVLRGIGGPSLLRLCHQLERLVWDELEMLATENPEIQRGMLATTRRVMEFVEDLNEVCAEAYEETEEALAGSGDAVRTRLVEHLVRGDVPRSGVLLSAAQACGLLPPRPIVAAVVRPEVVPADEAQAAIVAFALAGAGGDPAPVARIDGDFVTFRSADQADDGARAAGMSRLRERLAQQGLAVRIGVSVVHPDLTVAAEAYDDALVAVDGTSPERPVIDLGELRVTGLLLLRAGHPTAWRLVPEPVRRRLEDPSADAVALVDTVGALYAADGNVRSAAARLGVHANTVHGRLTRIKELTDLDTRRFADLNELMVAIQVAAAVRTAQ